jgi:hypothetical protein
MAMYRALVSYVEAFEVCQVFCNEKKDYSALFKLLTAYQTSLPSSLKTVEDVKMELHNEKCKQIYLKAYRDAIRILEKMEVATPTPSTVLNDTRLLIGIFSDAALKVETLSAIQFKYFDSVLGMARATDNKERLALIDAELEKLND